MVPVQQPKVALQLPTWGGLSTPTRRRRHRSPAHQPFPARRSPL